MREWAQPDIARTDRPLVLLLSFRDAAGLNLQYAAHHVVFYAPLWFDDAGVEAVSYEQQVKLLLEK